MKRGIALFLMLSAAPLAAAVKVNTPAPSFTLPEAGGGKESLSRLKGKVVFVDFWASWCAPCQAELPELDRLADEDDKQNVVFLAVNVDQDRSAAQRTLDRLHIDSSGMRVLWDTKLAVVGTYDVDSMPSSFIIDPAGVVRYVHVGYHPGDPSKWRQELNSLLAPASPTAAAAR